LFFWAALEAGTRLNHLFFYEHTHARKTTGTIVTIFIASIRFITIIVFITLIDFVSVVVIVITNQPPPPPPHGESPE
jgi:hypothetical protein